MDEDLDEVERMLGKSNEKQILSEMGIDNLNNYLMMDDRQEEAKRIAANATPKKFVEMVHKLSDQVTGGVTNGYELLEKSLKNLKMVPTGMTSLHHWKHHLIWNIVNYLVIYLFMGHSSVQNIVMNHSNLNALGDLLTTCIIPVIVTAFVEKSFRERWVLVETFKKSETIFRSLLESMSSPVFVVDKQQKILYSNTVGIEVLRRFYPNINAGRVPVHRKNINFATLLDNNSQSKLEGAIDETFRVKQAKVKIGLKRTLEENHTEPSLHTLTQLEDTARLIKRSERIYDIDCIQILWKDQYAVMLSVQDVTQSLKLQDTIADNYSKIRKDVRQNIQMLESTFSNISSVALLSNNHRPIIKAIANLDVLYCALVQAGTIFDITYDRLRISSDHFEVKNLLIYLFELMSLQSITKKNELHLKFEPGFPDAVIGDSVILGQLIHNIIANIVDSSKDSKIELFCQVDCILSNEKMLLSFNFEFPINDKLKLDHIKSTIFDSSESVESLMNSLLKDNFEAKFYLIRPLVNRLQGTVKLEEKETTILLRIEIPFKTFNTSIVGQTQTKKLLELPDMKTYNLSNARDSPNSNNHYWLAQPKPMPSENTIKASTSPLILKEKLSERIKRQMNESNTPSTGPSSGRRGVNSLLKYTVDENQEKKKSLEDLDKKLLDNKAIQKLDLPRPEELRKQQQKEQEEQEKIKKQKEEKERLRIQQEKQAEQERKEREEQLERERQEKDRIAKEKNELIKNLTDPQVGNLRSEFIRKNHRSDDRKLKLSMTQIMSSTPKYPTLTKFDLKSPDPYQRKINNNLKGIFEDFLGKRKPKAMNGQNQDPYKLSMEALKQNEDNLKSCIAYIILRIMARFTSKTKNLGMSKKSISNLELVRSSTSPSKQVAGLDEIEVIMRALKLNDGIPTADVFFEKINQHFGLKFNNERDRKSLMVFLSKYIKSQERRLYIMQNTRQKQDILDLAKFGNFQAGYDNFYDRRVLRRDDDEDSFSSDSNGPNVETPGLQHRILMSPSVSKAISLKNNPQRMLSKFGFTPEDIKMNGDAVSDNEIATSSTAQELEESKADKESKTNELLPFKMKTHLLPNFIISRTETKKRSWKGKKQVIEDTTLQFPQEFTILAVDDSEFVLNTLNKIQTSFKKKVETAKDGMIGVQKCKSMWQNGQMYHIILMDVIMPTLDGYEATKQIREAEIKNNHPPSYICGLSSNSDACIKPINVAIYTQLFEKRCKELGLDPTQFM